MLDGTHFFECDCGHAEHTIRFIVNKDESYPELYTEMMMNSYHGFFRRILIAVKYIFGINCKYGHFDTWLLNRNDANRLREVLDEYIDFCDSLPKKNKHDSVLDEAECETSGLNCSYTNLK